MSIGDGGASSGAFTSQILASPPLTCSLSSSQRGSVFGGQAPNVAHLHDGHVASPALRGKDGSTHTLTHTLGVLFVHLQHEALLPRFHIAG